MRSRLNWTSSDTRSPRKAKSIWLNGYAPPSSQTEETKIVTRLFSCCLDPELLEGRFHGGNIKENFPSMPLIRDARSRQLHPTPKGHSPDAKPFADFLRAAAQWRGLLLVQDFPYNVGDNILARQGIPEALQPVQFSHSLTAAILKLPQLLSRQPFREAVKDAVRATNDNTTAVKENIRKSRIWRCLLLKSLLPFCQLVEIYLSSRNSLAMRQWRA